MLAPNQQMDTPKALIGLATKSAVKRVALNLGNTLEMWPHFSCPIREVTEEVFSEGAGFDVSSIRGWKSIEASDMQPMPYPATAFIDPFDV